ncbi:MAG: transporter substrate-binding domain-containing protein [Tannerella sp.]|nr:transporter substrate-binding domain-containing protein [Tannerella sp.]
MKSKKIILFYSAILAAVLILMFISHQRSKNSRRDYDEIRAEGILRIVTEYNQSGYYVSGDTIEGFQYELSRAISKLSGLEVQMFLEMSLSESFSGLNRQKYDIIALNSPVNSEIKGSYLFTDPVVFNKQVLVQRTAPANDSVAPVRNQLELAGKTLYIPENSPALLRIRNLQHEIGDTIYVVEERRYSSEQLIIMVAKGDIDYAVCDKQIAAVAQKRFPEIDAETDISFMQLQSWAVRKESKALSDSLNNWLKTIRENGTFDEIYERYYNY